VQEHQLDTGIRAGLPDFVFRKSHDGEHAPHRILSTPELQGLKRPGVASLFQTNCGSSGAAWDGGGSWAELHRPGENPVRFSVSLPIVFLPPWRKVVRVADSRRFKTQCGIAV
jgi:hypothetical protein